MDEHKPALNIIRLISEENTETKPNMAKFLKTYVKSIRICISQGKVDIWPKIQYDISKCIVRFKDDQTLVRSTSGTWLSRGFDEVQLKEKDVKTINMFFERLEKFRFIRNGHEDVKVFSTEISKTNKEIKQQLDCIKSEDSKFIDYTPKITIS